MTSKNGSVGYRLPADDYAALKALAEAEDRSIPAQARHMMRKALSEAKYENEPTPCDITPSFDEFAARLQPKAPGEPLPG